MKKIIVSLLFISIFSLNLFADNSSVLNLELDLKLGFDFNPTLVIHDNNKKIGLAHEFNNSFLLGADFFFLKFSNFYLGVGFNHLFESKIKTKGCDAKSSISTCYIAGKYKMPLESKVFSTLYLIGNLGYANINIDNIYEFILHTDESGEYIDVIIGKNKFNNNGFVWEIGLGTEIFDNFIAELTYSSIYGNKEIIYSQYIENSSQKTIFSLIMFKLGYKFNINTSRIITKNSQVNNKAEILDKEIEKLRLQKDILELELEKEKLKQ
jgi:opacity protein-like surface antigen